MPTTCLGCYDWPNFKYCCIKRYQHKIITMRRPLHFFACTPIGLLILLCPLFSLPQQYQCTETRLNIDFGNASTPPPTLQNHKNYRYQSSDCPNDGNCAIRSYTYGCFGNKWHNLSEDHTPGDTKGGMLLVNAAVRPGPFFSFRVEGLKPGAKMELALWLLNICLSTDGCRPTPPQIRMRLRTDDGTLVGDFETGALQPTTTPKWQWYSGQFTMPANATALTLVMEDLAEGGCGNDFAVDDITLRECVLIPPPPPVEKPVVKPAPPVVTRTVPKPAPPKPAPTLTSPAKQPIAKEVVLPPSPKPITAPNIQPKAAGPIPAAIATRANPLVKTIETPTCEMTIDLYDNGDIDGDTISIYHNGQLVVHRAGLSAKPVHLSIMVDKNHPRHELTMVAENLGSIPPNTSLMVVTAQNKRYEVFISSSEQKNAKVEVVWKE